jgi:hypothetical protein
VTETTGDPWLTWSQEIAFRVVVPAGIVTLDGRVEDAVPVEQSRSVVVVV